MKSRKVGIFGAILALVASFWVGLGTGVLAAEIPTPRAIVCSPGQAEQNGDAL